MERLSKTAGVNAMDPEKRGSQQLVSEARSTSLKELAAETKLSVSHISAIERGTNLPNIESFLAICR